MMYGAKKNKKDPRTYIVRIEIGRICWSTHGVYWTGKNFGARDPVLLFRRARRMQIVKALKHANIYVEPRFGARYVCRVNVVRCPPGDQVMMADVRAGLIENLLRRDGDIRLSVWTEED